MIAVRLLVMHNLRMLEYNVSFNKFVLLLKY